MTATLRIIQAYPPNIGAILRRFPYVKGRPGILFAYGDRIYNPSGHTIPYQLACHEEEHGRRQLLIGTEKWWDRYLNEPEFLWTQELFAHQAEYKAFKQFEPRMDKCEKYLHDMSTRFSGPLYENCISYARARALIDGFENPGPNAT